MNKKLGVLFVLLVLGSLFSNFVGAQINQEDLENDTFVQGTKELQEAYDERRWEYLSEQWKEVLLKNKFISALDSFFRQIDFIFVLLFGEHYDISLTLLFVVMFWVFFGLMFAKILSEFSTFGEKTSDIVALISTIILAQLGAYNFLSVLVFKVLFFKEGAWPWIFTAVFLILYFTLIAVLRRVIREYGERRKKSKEKLEKFKDKTKREVMDVRMRGMEGALGEIGGSFR